MLLKELLFLLELSNRVVETSRLNTGRIDRHRLSHRLLHHLLHQRHARVVLRRMRLLQIQLLHCRQREMEVALFHTQTLALRQTDQKDPARVQEREEALALPSCGGRNTANAKRRNRRSFGRERS